MGWKWRIRNVLHRMSSFSVKNFLLTIVISRWGYFPIHYFPTRYYWLHREEERLLCQQIYNSVESCGCPQSTLPTCKLQEGVTLHPGMRGKTTALNPQHTANLTTITQLQTTPKSQLIQEKKKKTLANTIRHKSSLFNVTLEAAPNTQGWETNDIGVLTPPPPSVH